MQNYNFTCYFAWVRNLVFHPKEETLAKGVRE
jgi:hypothetical protein